jgi:multidrug efflux pump subunit AcrA (membrane-fusion protein)
MKLLKSLKLRQSVAFVASLFVVLVVLDELAASPISTSSKAKPRTHLTTKVITAQPVTELPGLQRLGSVEPVRESHLTAQVSGRVTHISKAFKKGNMLNQGQLLISIEPLNYEISLAEAEHNVLAAEMELKNVTISFTKDSLKLSLVKSKLKITKAQLKQAKNELAYTQIRLPFNGEITAIETHLGEYISVGAIIAKVLPQQDKQIKVQVSEQDFARLNLTDNAQSVEIYSLDKSKQWSATIIGVSQHTENLQRTIYLKIPEDGTIKTNSSPLYGQHIYAQLPMKLWLSTFSLPESSLTLKGEIWWLNNNNKLVKIQLTDYVLANSNVYFSLTELKEKFKLTSNLSQAVLYPSSALNSGMQIVPSPVNLQ